MRKSHSRLNMIYSTMKKRCYNSNCKSYKDYGGRGITVCDEWLNTERYKKGIKGWYAFKDWALSSGYTDELTIDRIDVNGNYEPTNCRWATRKEQNNNQRTNRVITYCGKTQTLKQWCEELKLNYGTTVTRLNEQHWSIEKAFVTKENTHLRMITYKGKTQSMKAWCIELNIPYQKTNSRINSLHWSPEKAFEKELK